MEGRRIGTFTMGLCLLIFGILFLVHLFIPTLDYLLIFHLWPVIFILLGVEILYYSLRGGDKLMRYDIAAVILIIVLAIFAMGMAGMDLLLEHMPEGIWL